MTNLSTKNWKERNKGKVREQKRRYRQRYPEKIKNEKIRYLDKKFKNNPDLIKNLTLKSLQYFEKLTRLKFDNILPKKCEVCGISEDLQIHHKRYAYPIIAKDLMRVCRKHHIEEHQKIMPS